MTLEKRLKIIDKMHKALWEAQGGDFAHGMPFKDAEEMDSYGYFNTCEKLLQIVRKELKKGNVA